MPNNELPKTCPKCGENFPYLGDDGKEYSKLIGVSSWELDRIIAWECPVCHHQWPRN